MNLFNPFDTGAPGLVSFDNYDVQMRTGQVHFVCIALLQTLPVDLVRNSPRIGSQYLCELADAICGNRPCTVLQPRASTSTDIGESTDSDAEDVEKDEISPIADGASASTLSAGADLNVDVGNQCNRMNIPHLTQDLMKTHNILPIDPKKAKLPDFSE